MRGPAWVAKWMPSSHFVKLLVPVNRIQQPMPPKYPALIELKAMAGEFFLEEPIFIDRNRPELTGWKGLQILCIDGKHRVGAARMAEVERILAYVGVQALPHFQNPEARGYDWKEGWL